MYCSLMHGFGTKRIWNIQGMEHTGYGTYKIWNTQYVELTRCGTYWI